MTRLLVIEDGTEYTDAFRRFLAARFAIERAGSGGEALARLAAPPPIDAVFLDTCFDRVPPDALLGDVDALAESQFDGDLLAARRHLEAQQGFYVLAALRGAGHRVPVLLSYDFSAEPRRFERVRAAHGPLDALPDVLRPAEVVERLEALLRG